MSVKYIYIYLQGVPGLRGTEGAKQQWHEIHMPQTQFVLAEGVNRDLDSCHLNHERTHLGIYGAALRENARPVQCLDI